LTVASFTLPSSLATRCRVSAPADGASNNATPAPASAPSPISARFSDPAGGEAAAERNEELGVHRRTYFHCEGHHPVERVNARGANGGPREGRPR
jgi:hypothetical protein